MSAFIVSNNTITKGGTMKDSHRQKISKALKGRQIVWRDKIAASMRGNHNAKGQSFTESRDGIYHGHKYHAWSKRKGDDHTWITYISFEADDRTITATMHKVRKITPERLEMAFQSVQKKEVVK